jgi:hypothetical protein
MMMVVPYHLCSCLYRVESKAAGTRGGGLHALLDANHLPAARRLHCPRTAHGNFSPCQFCAAKEGDASTDADNTADTYADVADASEA